MEFREFDFAQIESGIQAFWDEIDIRSAFDKKAKDAPKFYFCDGPPYTSGRVHIGTAWNKSMKDLLIRAKRMQGFNVWDRAGYDMHGLPNEHGVMEDLGLKTKEDIEKYGLDKFIKACRNRAEKNLLAMNDDFIRLGTSLSYEDAYRTMSNKWIDAVWWLVKKAYTDGRLYEGLRPMAWDPVHESALAKHELEYKSVEDMSIFVKFKRAGTEDEYFVVWTTTPWTIPFNLMIMVHPDESYDRVQVGDEVWIVGSPLTQSVLDAAGTSGKVLETVTGDSLKGVDYEHFLGDTFDYAKMKADFPNVHKVVTSKRYVTMESGSGLVHAAPGCGPEDYEIGVREKVPAWNLLDEKGRYPEGAGVFSGKRAREEDDFFIDEIEKAGALAAKVSYVHDYPCGQRSKAEIVYKTTKQWFFKVDDLKEKMIAANKEVHWVPTAGFNAFNSWLENLRDNSITKQRFWGTPFPVWKSEDGDVRVIESIEELEKLSGASIDDPHKPWIDDITFEENGKKFTRIPDVIDVWVDAGVASFACLNFPHEKELFEEFFPADFIIEGNDQVRGWFNLLMVASILGFDKVPFKNVYMHGFINDAKGRKMSKSVGNYIVPGEVLDKYGVDATRLYLISATRAGNDLNYNHTDCEVKNKSLHVYWNMHKYLLDTIKSTGLAPKPVSAKDLSQEDAYILSRVHQTIATITDSVNKYELDRIPGPIESLLMEISRTYIQLVRPKIRDGSKEEQQRILSVLSASYISSLKMLAPVCPFFTEAIWQNLRSACSLPEESIHLCDFPQSNEKLIDKELEQGMQAAQQLTSMILSARDKAQIGVRWPLPEVQVQTTKMQDELVQGILDQTNVKKIEFVDNLDLSYEIQPNFKTIGASFGEKTAEIATYIKENQDKVEKEYADQGYITVGTQQLNAEMLKIDLGAPDDFIAIKDGNITLLLDTRQSDDLLQEGYVRELTRRVQQLRKSADLEKTDSIHLYLAEDLKELVGDFEEELLGVVGATKVSYEDPGKAPHTDSSTIKGKKIEIGFFHLDT